MDNRGSHMMCIDCTCCREGNCTRVGRWSGYCCSVCPCTAQHLCEEWYGPGDDDEYEPLFLHEDDDA